MADQKLIIPIEKIKTDFQAFLEPEHNRRIIFSGPFGIGKTYFLNEFFKEKTEYFPIFLRPINYSLLSNEDVFKFIKYDILAQLINQKKINIDNDIKASSSESLKSFFKNNKLLVLKNLLKIIPKLGGFSDSIEQVEELYLKYRESKEKLSKELSAEQVQVFNKEFEEHFLSEFDNVSSIIKYAITKEELQTVLVIDDLDRLDPEHIFRLFNVFSAHFDLVNDDFNKFNFDKIIFVCDIENIRKIFSHKYGLDVDFSGYIDKFYSSEIYDFNNNQEVLNYVDKIFLRYENNNLQRGGSQSSILGIIKPIFSDLILAKTVNMRMVKNIEQGKHGFRRPYILNYFRPEVVKNYNFQILQVVDFLFDIFGKDIDNLLDSINKTKKLARNNASMFKEVNLKHCLPILNKSINTKSKVWTSPWGKSIQYELKEPISTEKELYFGEFQNSNNDWILTRNYYDFLEIVVNNLRSMGVFDNKDN